jgi:hypothetical protein
MWNVMRGGLSALKRDGVLEH